MAPDETKKLQVFKLDPLTTNDVPPVEIRITVKQQDIGSTTSVFLKPDAFEGTSDKWIASEITRVVEKITEQFREEYFFNVYPTKKGATHVKINNPIQH